ncbi:MAG: hypothetical protein AAB489_06080 [Patescibacteria group bacterium]
MGIFDFFKPSERKRVITCEELASILMAYVTQEAAAVGKLIGGKKFSDLVILKLLFEVLAYYQALLILNVAKEYDLSNKQTAQFGMKLNAAIFAVTTASAFKEDIHRILIRDELHQLVGDYLADEPGVARLNQQDFARLLRFLGSSPNEANWILKRAVICFTRLLGINVEAAQGEMDWQVPYEQLIPRDAFALFEWWSAHMTNTTAFMECLTKALGGALLEEKIFSFLSHGKN